MNPDWFCCRVPDRSVRRLLLKLIDDGKVPLECIGRTITDHYVHKLDLRTLGWALRQVWPNIVAIDGYQEGEGFEAEATIYLWFDDDEEGVLWKLTYA